MQIPSKIQVAFWARAGGRCEHHGCNGDLIGDLIAGREDGKFGFIAHIVADSADGPRGDPVRSPLLAKDLNNLMLLWAKHHKGVDVDYLADHPEGVLLEMKAEHEDRIAIVAERVHAPGGGTLFARLPIDSAPLPRVLPPRDGVFLKNRLSGALGLAPLGA